MRVIAALALVVAAVSVSGDRPPPPQGPPPKVFAFVSHRGGAEVRRLERVGAKIDIVAPNWYALEPASGLLHAPTGRQPGELLATARKRDVRVWPVVNARTAGSPAWRSRGARARIVASLRAAALGPGASGVTLDMEGLQPGDREAFSALVHEATAALHAVHRALAVYVSRAGPAYDWAAIGQAADLLLAAGYNQSWAGGKPGPISTSEGFADVVTRAQAAAGPKAVPLLGAFGYRWPRHGRGELIASDDALRLRRARHAHVRRADGQERFHVGHDTIVYETAAGLRKRFRAARAAGVRWIGLFTLGREPAHFWPGLETARQAKSATRRPASSS
jgi:hypothetical protein